MQAEGTAKEHSKAESMKDITEGGGHYLLRTVLPTLTPTEARSFLPGFFLSPIVALNLRRRSLPTEGDFLDDELVIILKIGLFLCTSLVVTRKSYLSIFWIQTYSDLY